MLSIMKTRTLREHKQPPPPKKLTSLQQKTPFQTEGVTELNWLLARIKLHWNCKMKPPLLTAKVDINFFVLAHNGIQAFPASKQKLQDLAFSIKNHVWRAILLDFLLQAHR